MVFKVDKLQHFCINFCFASPPFQYWPTVLAICTTLAFPSYRKAFLRICCSKQCATKGSQIDIVFVRERGVVLAHPSAIYRRKTINVDHHLFRPNPPGYISGNAWTIYHMGHIVTYFLLLFFPKFSKTRIIVLFLLVNRDKVIHAFRASSKHWHKNKHLLCYSEPQLAAATHCSTRVLHWRRSCPIDLR